MTELNAINNPYFIPETSRVGTQSENTHNGTDSSFSGERNADKSFAATLQNVVTSSEIIDGFVKELTKKYGLITIKTVFNDDHVVKNFVLSGSLGAVTIAPNILENMISDLAVRENVENNIVRHFAEVRQVEAELLLQKRQSFSTGIIFHSDGNWSEWVCREPIHEVGANINKIHYETGKVDQETLMHVEIRRKNDAQNSATT